MIRVIEVGGTLRVGFTHEKSQGVRLGLYIFLLVYVDT